MLFKKKKKKRRRRRMKRGRRRRRRRRRRRKNRKWKKVRLYSIRSPSFGHLVPRACVLRLNLTLQKGST
jgi:hypothetical protein